MRRFTYLLHRWLGIAVCVPMLLWFVSGVVMMYVGYPKLSTAERMERLPALEPQRVRVDLAAALAAAALDAPPKSVRLTSVGGQPRWIFEVDKARVLAVDATTGRRIATVTSVDAVAAVEAFAPGAGARAAGTLREDAWTHSRALDVHRPLHVVQTDDVDRTRWYVSSATGEVVRDATAAERGWNWVGAWLHWIYPLRGGVVDSAWHDVVVWLSVVATLLTVTGLVVGVWRWRFAGRYRNGSKSPYRQAMPRWHHLTGLAGGALALTWIFSGLMSMNPWKVFDSHAHGGPPAVDTAAFAGGPLVASAFDLSPADALTRFAADRFAVRELEWRRVDGAGWIVATGAGCRTRVLRATRDAVVATGFDFAALTTLAARLLPTARVAETTTLVAHDFWWYERAPHTMLGHVERRLPMLRIVFDDPHATWVHIDPATGSVVGVLDRRGRVKRVLFALLHSWDWRPLLANRPVWDVALVLGSAVGIGLSATGVVVGWRRLRGVRPVRI
ncbi:MAG: PepSY domain-containing protein [Burkholderiales bacterium]|jgi:hypothetical protein|nr:PepSY domain-containing protein [Burkholderiales bacterium]